MPHVRRDPDHHFAINQLNQFPWLCKSIPHGPGFLFDKSAPGSLYSTPRREHLLNHNGERCPMKFFICVLGMVMIVEGLPYFAFPEKMKRWMLQIQEISDDTLRRFGLMLMLGGLALAYIGKAG